MAIDDRSLSDCSGVHANMLETLKLHVRSRIANGESRIDFSKDVALYLIDRAQRWELMHCNIPVRRPPFRGLPGRIYNIIKNLMTPQRRQYAIHD